MTVTLDLKALERAIEAAYESTVGAELAGEARGLDTTIESATTAAIRAYQQAAKPAGEWQPIETAPRDGTPFLAWCPNLHATGGVLIYLWLVGPKQFVTVPGAWADRGGKITHWMPLPAPPAGESGK